MARVLVTGATGFIASHTIADLLAHGYDVRGTVRSRERALREAALARIPGAERLELVEADLLRRRLVRGAGAGLRSRAAHREPLRDQRQGPAARSRRSRREGNRGRARRGGEGGRQAGRADLVDGRDHRRAAGRPRADRGRLEREKLACPQSLLFLQDAGRAGRLALHGGGQARLRSRRRQPVSGDRAELYALRSTNPTGCSPT